MNIGISITSAYRTRDVRDGASQMIRRANAAAMAGLDSLFVGDHHVVPSPYYQNTPMMGRLLAEWDDRLCGALFLLPLWNPVLVAEQAATLACIARGRFVLQCGLGAGQRLFQAMGRDIRYRPSSLEEAIGCLRALWSGQTVTLDGRWQFQDARISPLPPEPIDIWIGASAPVAIDRAARIGDAWLADPGMPLEAAARSMDIYREALARHGKPEPATIAIRRDIYVAGTAKDAEKVRNAAVKEGYRGFDPDALIIGTPSQVAESFQSFHDLGYTDIIIRNLNQEPSKAIDSIERLREVKALLNG